MKFDLPLHLDLEVTILRNNEKTSKDMRFLVACKRLLNRLCRSVRRSLTISFFGVYERFLALLLLPNSFG